ncbi:hypothetical protein H696_05979 [Fonticula alba]|uniref:Uncharacterized protein n=1 Tax=Fonticula alba TaxID=691883 RepID=A0A058Z243_FONAL|nr:hypothetical protein H696_05979 [Fonticula alba]KCV67582.1 hypothetical protein H696_05979 [Fonticula alba]|eukprot:XP_009498023.1 hypothetical protein H696_05979 [Fonticula alba]
MTSPLASAPATPDPAQRLSTRPGRPGGRAPPSRRSKGPAAPASRPARWPWVLVVLLVVLSAGLLARQLAPPPSGIVSDALAWARCRPDSPSYLPCVPGSWLSDQTVTIDPNGLRIYSGSRRGSSRGSGAGVDIRPPVVPATEAEPADTLLDTPPCPCLCTLAASESESNPLCASIGTLDALVFPGKRLRDSSETFHSLVQKLSREPLFRFFGVRLYRACAAFDDASMKCSSEYCQVIRPDQAEAGHELCNDVDNAEIDTWLSKTEEKFFNHDLFYKKVVSHPERVRNLYFAYSVLHQAIAKLADRPDLLLPANAQLGFTDSAAALIAEITEHAREFPPTFDADQLFNSDTGGLKSEFRERFRQLERLMDCVECEKCRLWGKVQILGYGTALKVLLNGDPAGPRSPVLFRNELTALIQTANLVGESIEFLHEWHEHHHRTGGGARGLVPPGGHLLPSPSSA